LRCVFLGGAYSLWLFNRIAFGNLKSQYTNKFLDLNFREFIIFVPLILGTFIIGVRPEIFLSFLSMSTNSLVEFLYF